MPRQDANVLAGADDEPFERRRASSLAKKRIERRVRGLRPTGNEGYAAGGYARQTRNIASRILDDPP